jgi:hypothetical protein
LASHLGRVDVRKMLSEIDLDEFCEWVGYNKIEPFIQQRADYRVAYALSILMSVVTGKEVKPDGFMPRFGLTAEEIDKEMMESAANNFLALANTQSHGKVK